ncbi:unnamed protein product, partial [Owenia fusiformis]
MAKYLIPLAFGICLVEFVLAGAVADPVCEIVERGEYCGKLMPPGIFTLAGRCAEGDECFCKPEKPENEKPGNENAPDTMGGDMGPEKKPKMEPKMKQPK